MNSNIFDLSERVALVTGGSKGLGKAMASGLARAGADILICSRNPEELAAAAQEIRSGTEARVESMTADLSKRGEAAELAAAVLERMGRVDILVNNAGTNVPQPIDEISDDDWDRVLELNVSSCMSLMRALVPRMKERRWGRIINISSVMGFGSAAGRASYSMTKSALLGLTRASALDLGPHNITVNCIAPGPFLTDLPRRLLSEEQKNLLASRTALQRWGEPEELIGPVLLLASDAGSYITGTTLAVDGGMLGKVW